MALRLKVWVRKARASMNRYLNEQDMAEEQIRKSLLILLVCMIMAMVMALVYEFEKSKGANVQIDFIDVVALPILMLIIAISFVGLLKKKFSTRKVMVVVYIFSVVYMMIVYNHQFSVFFVNVQMLSQNTYWFAVLYVAAFLAFPMRIALGFVYAIVGLIAFVTIYNIILFPERFSSEIGNASVMQFLLSGLAIIILQTLFGAQRDRIRSMHIAAYKDSLTNIANRRAAEERLKKLHQSKQPYNFVMLDIDCFKKINDTYGHDVGDQVLIAVAKIAGQHISKDSMVARWGGEEFAFILAEEPLSVTHRRLDMFREDLRRWHFKCITGVTASFGVDTNTGGEHPDYTTKRADEALYHAKRNGKDAVIIAGTKSL